jgi:hypothetical protein
MIQVNKLIGILIVLIGFSNKLKASDDLKADSLKVTQIVNEFYSWYLTAIKNKEYAEFKPRFVETKNGKTSLDFSEYLENLSANGFSDSLIIKEKLSYSECVDNLEKVNFTDFKKTVFTDLDEYEQANCDFGNYYRWIGGQEPIDGISINGVKFITADIVLVSIDYFEHDTKENKKHYYGKNSLTLKRLNNEWSIDNFDSWKTD